MLLYINSINYIPAVPVLGASSGSNESMSKLTCKDFELCGSILFSAKCITSWIPKINLISISINVNCIIQ